MRKTAVCLTLVGLVTGVAGAAVAQPVPTSQPKFVSIIREQVKIGRGADHAKWEAGWPAAYDKAKATQPYLALVSETGSRETWYVTPFESHAALEAASKRDEADPVLSAELERLSKGDAEFLSDLRTLQAAARPDLSHGQFPDLAKVRYYEITIFRVKPGYDSGFAAVAKAYAGAAARSAPQASWRTYEVIAGAPGGTFLIFSSLESYAAFDQAMEDGMNMSKSFSGEELVAMQKFLSEGLISAETNRFRLDSQQSYVGKETREKDPAFWMPKPPAKKAAQP